MEIDLLEVKLPHSSFNSNGHPPRLQCPPTLLEVVVPVVAAFHALARGFDAGQGGGWAFLLLAGHVVAEGDLGARFLGRPAGCGDGQVGVAAQVFTRDLPAKR